MKAKNTAQLKDEMKRWALAQFVVGITRFFSCSNSAVRNCDCSLDYQFSDLQSSKAGYPYMDVDGYQNFPN
jgi:hypothetical protein